MLASAAVLALSAWAPPLEIGTSWGLNLGFNDLSAHELTLMKAAGVKWVRRDLFWHVVEPQKGRWDWSVYDRLLADLSPLGIRPVFILCYGNGLYQKDSPRTPEARAAFARYVRQAVRRYKGLGVIWEVWNEPNNHHWPPRPNVDEYIALALEASRALKSEAPGEALVGPGLAGFDWPFIEKCLRAGLLKYWDGVTVHPYRPMEPETAADDYARLRQLIERHAPRGKAIPILSGEWGYADINTQGEERQGAWFVRQHLANLASGISLTIWYNFSDNGPEPANAEHHFGIVEMAPGFAPKPAHRAAERITKDLGGFRFNKRISGRSQDDWILLFEKGGRQSLVFWNQKGSVGLLPIGPPKGEEWRVATAFGEPVESAGANRLPFMDGSPKWTAPASSAWMKRAASVPPAPPYLSVGSATELARALRAFRRQPFILESEGATVAVGRGRRADAALRRLPRFAQRSSEPHHATLTTQGISQPMILRHSAPIGLSWSPAGSGAKLRISPEGRAFSGSLVLRGLGKARSIRVSAPSGGHAEASVPAIHQPFSLELVDAREGAVRREGPLVLERPGLGGQVVLEGDAKAEGEARASHPGPADGPARGSLGTRLAYRFGPGWKYALLNPPSPIPVRGRPQQFSVWVKGDGRGAVLLMRYVDASGQTFQPEGIPIDWTGWRLATFPMDGSTGGRWGGANDGRIVLPVRISALAVLDNPRGAGVEGEIVLAGPMVVSTLGGR